MIASSSGNPHGAILTNYTIYSQTYTWRSTFTQEDMFNELTFLDMLIRSRNNHIITYIYYKPTDTNQYLHFKCHHPKSCLKSIPSSLACSICTIVADKHLWKTRLGGLHKILKTTKLPHTTNKQRFWTSRKNT